MACMLWVSTTPGRQGAPAWTDSSRDACGQLQVYGLFAPLVSSFLWRLSHICLLFWGYYWLCIVWKAMCNQTAAGLCNTTVQPFILLVSCGVDASHRCA